MKTKIMTVLAVAMVAAFITAGVQAEQENVWVTDEGQSIHLGQGDNAMFFGDDAVILNASDLRDGESRIVGMGEKQVTLTRQGQTVTIQRTAAGEDAKVEVLCDTERDKCQVITFDNEPEKVMIVVEKTRECVNGVGDCEKDIADLAGLGGGHKNIVIKRVECDEAGNCNEFEIGDQMVVDVDVAAGDAPHAVFVHHGMHDANQVVLACPEGDSKIHVDKSEAEDTFLCPKHSVPMEQAAVKKIRKIKLGGN